jgi:hypothetical protein
MEVARIRINDLDCIQPAEHTNHVVGIFLWDLNLVEGHLYRPKERHLVVSDKLN